LSFDGRRAGEQGNTGISISDATGLPVEKQLRPRSRRRRLCRTHPGEQGRQIEYGRLERGTAGKGQIHALSMHCEQ
jgi:hypothetical protein